MILALWPPALQCQLSALLFVCVSFVLFFFLFVVVLSGEPKQKQGRGLVDRKLVQAVPPPKQKQGRGLVDRKLVQAAPPPPPVILLRLKAALLFWFFGDFRCGVPLLVVILVIYMNKCKNR